MDINFQHCLHVCDPPHPCPITSMEDKVKAEYDSLQEKGAGCGDSQLLCAHRTEGLALGSGDRPGQKDGPCAPEARLTTTYGKFSSSSSCHGCGGDWVSSPLSPPHRKAARKCNAHNQTGLFTLNLPDKDNPWQLRVVLGSQVWIPPSTHPLATASVMWLPLNRTRLPLSPSRIVKSAGSHCLAGSTVSSETGKGQTATICFQILMFERCYLFWWFFSLQFLNYPKSGNVSYWSWNLKFWKHMAISEQNP